MKKTLGFGVLMMSLMSLGSCSSEMDMPQNSNGNSSKFALTLPAEVGSRAFAQGEHVNQLSYAIYLHNGDGTAPGALVASELNKSVSFTKGVYELPVQLVNGKAYDIVFWADCEGGMYEFDADTHTITMKDAAFASNMDEADAFYGVLTTPVIDGTYSDNVQLYRPFAQLNLGASDLDNEMFHELQEITDGKVYATLTVDSYSQFDIFSGTCAGERVSKTYAMPSDAIDTEANAFPYMSDTYKYVAMHYLLMPESTPEQESDVANLKYEFYNKKDASAPFYSIEVPNVPVRQNYSTNLYGQIFTENGSISVEIKPGITDISWPIKSTVVTTTEELVAAVASAKDGETITIPAGTTITLTAEETPDGVWTGDFFEVSSDIDIHVSGTLAFEGCAQIVAMDNAKLTLSGEGTIKSTSTASLLRADSGDITVNGNLKFELTNGGLGYAAATIHQGEEELTKHTLTIENAEISATLPQVPTSSVLGIADGGTISMKNATVRSNVRVCAYISGIPENNEQMLLTASDCRFIVKADTEFSSYAFVTYPGKLMKYEFIDSYIASNTGCVRVFKDGTLIYKGSSIKKACRMANFKNSGTDTQIPVVVESGATGISISGYSGIYNEWNDDDATIVSVLDRGAANCYMMASYYTGPTQSATTGQVIPGYAGYVWGEISGIFKYGNILTLDGEIVDKTSAFKYRYSK